MDPSTSGRLPVDKGMTCSVSTREEGQSRRGAKMKRRCVWWARPRTFWTGLSSRSSCICSCGSREFGDFNGCGRDAASQVVIEFRVAD
uniref:Uncharacterized protein n=1 Tax=Mycena chlorophos TaxID=658473 RepID=A0ABQ0LS72_MYCCL|nr:predicted protein [Mycena chlorophos]